MTEDPTDEIPPDQAVTQAAWSAVGPVYDYPPTGAQPPLPPPRHEFAWRRIAGTAAAVIAGALATAVLIHIGPAWREPPWRPPTPVTVTATAVSILPAPVTETTTETTTATVSPTPKAYPPPSVAYLPPSADQQYLSLLAATPGVRITDPTAAIATGHRQCDYLIGTGNTVPNAASHLQRQYAHLTNAEALGITNAAVNAYCPQFGGNPYE